MSTETCIDCGKRADLLISEVPFCCEHYSQRVAAMKRNADGLAFDALRARYREDTAEERAARDQVRRLAMDDALKRRKASLGVPAQAPPLKDRIKGAELPFHDREV